MLEEQPERRPIYYNGFHRLMTRRFPYKIFYRVEGDRVIVFGFCTPNGIIAGNFKERPFHPVCRAAAAAKTRMVLTTVLPMNLVAADVSPLHLIQSNVRADSRRLLRFGGSMRECFRSGGRQMPQGFGEKDECGFRPKAAMPGW
jgi:hypothetical protein